MVRALLLAALTASTPAVGSAGQLPSPTPPTVVAPAPAPAWRWPLVPRPAVVRPFHAPPTTWGAGHRGVDLTASVGQPVLSAGAGQVVFVGRIAGRGVMVIRHQGGLRSTYEPVLATVLVGTVVAAGTPVGRLTAEPGHCAPASCLHWGVLRGRQYLDPLTLLGAGPVVLLPLQ